MEKMKQIMYGVTDFARIRAENGYFVDRTGPHPRAGEDELRALPAAEKE